MDGDEMEISKEELQKWIRKKVKKNDLVSPDVLKKYSLLQSLLERREKQAAHLLKLCESVAACEATVKKQYLLLGWEYRDTDSDDDDDDDDDDISGCGRTPLSPSESVLSESQVCHPPATNGCTRLLPNLLDSETLNRDDGKKSSYTVIKESVVVLTRLPASKIRALHLTASPKHQREDEPSNNLDSDVQWVPEDDFPPSRSNKRRKVDRMWNETPANSGATPKARTSSDAEINAAKKKTKAPQANKKTKDKSKSTTTTTTTTTTTPADDNVTGASRVCRLSAPCQSTDKATKTPPSVSLGELRVTMRVLARRTAMSWQSGRIVEILTKEDGRLKYKVHFEERGKSLVSGHHIAFNCMPKVEHLFVGARVVVRSQTDLSQFYPGVLAELPSRKNHLRFLVFTDDHTPVYVSLPLFHMVSKPLTDPLDDIPDGAHKDFMKEYLKNWPYPPMIQYKVGQLINAEFNGVQQKCEVQVADCSLIKVVFQEDQHKEWIYRGSTRLEHIITMREHLESKKKNLEKKKSTGNLRQPKVKFLL
ncbi:histone-lysine N-methyltransferase SETDB1-B-like [Seriola dumerili]|uniref:histone-lysine N-methyltransferase SETDB1-B-like n=1 Tax=Seriola dumerili TaxID=41447 RepID=UPI000BBEE67C|nr:histone-lysine N-methyltransferase SETDB1-B-like [Seriola dumerili]XP_022602636.1 histone-lysine N-methyltransferase SETDB1-B-like [Seriola dumerili]